MSGLLSIAVQEARGLIATNADLDHLCVVIGCSSLGSGLSPFFLSGQAAQASVGYGDAPDTLCQIIEQRQSDGSSGQKLAAALYTTPVTTAGSYGAIDVSGVTGTAIVAPHSATDPYGTYEAELLIIAGGSVGTAGIKFQYSLDGGRNFSNTIGLGTAGTYVIPNSNVQFDIGSKVTGSTDASSGALYGGGGTLDGLTLILTQQGGSPLTLTLNGSTNTANEAALLAAITAEWPLITATVVATHLVLTSSQGPIVIGAGTANSALGLSASAVAGSLVAGDVVKCRTFAPAPSTSDIDAAFTAIANSTVDCAIIVCEFPCTATIAAHVTTGLNAMAAAGKRCLALIRTRIPNFESSEDEATWASAMESDFSSFTDSRICKRASYLLVTDAMTSREYLRSDLAQFAADVARVDRFVWPCAPADQPMANASLVDGSGATVGHDEGDRGAVTGLSNETLGNTFSCVQRLSVPQRREDVYNTVPWVCYASDERIRNIMVRRLANSMETTAVNAGVSQLGGRLFYTSTGPSTGVLSAESVALVHSVLFDALSDEYASEISNAKDGALDTGLVQVSPNVTKSGGNLIGVSATIAAQVAGFMLTLTITMAIEE